MNNKSSNFLKNILKNKKSLIELIIVAIFISIGVNFLTSSIFEYVDFKYKNISFILIGTALLIITLIYYLNNFFGNKVDYKNIQGFYIINTKSKKLVNIDNYDLVNKLNNILKYSLREDKALKKNWNKIKFEHGHPRNKEYQKIISEAAEYYLIEKLSDHLSYYFTRPDMNQGELIDFKRSDIPDILLKNRFLELFSKPLNQRELFINEEKGSSTVNHDKKKKNSSFKLVEKFMNGAKYKYFELTLPKNSKLKRNNIKGWNSISLITKRFTLKLSTFVIGNNTDIPENFLKYYLNIDKSKHSIFEIEYYIEVKFNPISIFSNKNWQYYKWIDSFIKHLEKDTSKNYYFNKKINWDKIYPIIKSLKNEEDNNKK